MPSDTVFLTAHNVYAGGSLVFDWLIYDASGDIITNPEQVRSISIYSNTLAVDASNSITKVLRGDDLVDPNSNLVNQTQVDGYTTGVEYSSIVTAWILDASLNPLTAHKVVSDPLNKKVRGNIASIQPTINVISGDDYVDIQFDTPSANLFTNYISEASGGILDYAKMYATIYTNDGTGLVETVIPWASALLNSNTVRVDGLLNGTVYEVFGLYTNALQYIAGDSKSSVGAKQTPTNRPNPPTQIATISTFEYGGSTSAGTVNVLFNTPAQQDPSTNLYTIYRTDLSNNGFTPITDATNVGTLNVGTTGNYSYNGVDYSYNFVDNSTSAGKFYGYQISGTNVNGEGLLSTPLQGVRDGKQCSAPSITLTPRNANIVVDISYNTPLGGFDLSTNYIVSYTSTDASGTLSGPTPITITGLTNGQQCTVVGYAQTSNSNYTVDYDVSAGLIGNTINYLSAQSSPASATPYTTSNAPTNVVAQPNYDISHNPTDSVLITWSSDVSYAGQFLNYRVTSIDVSSNVTVQYYVADSSGNPSDPSGVPTHQFYNDTAATTGNVYSYTVESYYTPVDQPVYSNATASSNTTFITYYTPNALSAGQAVPFTKPNVPGINAYFDNSAQVIVTLTNPTNTGGQSPVHLHFNLTDPSGNPLGGSAGIVDNAVSGQAYPVQLAPNTLVNVNNYSYTFGPDYTGYGPAQYDSLHSIFPVPGNTYLQPVITNSAIDASGILHIDSSNNGSPLSFIEGLVIDSSNALQISYATGVIGTSGTYYVNGSTTGFRILQNDNVSAKVTVNFQDQHMQTGNQTLAIITNTAGADVVNTFL